MLHVKDFAKACITQIVQWCLRYSPHIAAHVHHMIESIRVHKKPWREAVAMSSM